MKYTTEILHAPRDDRFGQRKWTFDWTFSNKARAFDRAHEVNTNGYPTHVVDSQGNQVAEDE